MAAFTGSPVSADDYVDQITNPSTKVLAAGVVMIRHFTKWTHTSTQGSGTGEINWGTIPAGEYYVLPTLSVIVTTAYSANSDIHLGFRAYLALDGTTTSEDDNAFFDNVDAATGGTFVGTLAPVLISAAEPVKIYSLIDTGNIDADDTAEVWLAYAKLR